jgi:hypothetical protein
MAPPITVVDMRQHYGNILYHKLAEAITFVDADLKEAGMWNPLFTPAKATGMIMAAGYSMEELHHFATNGEALATVALEVLDCLNEQAPVGAADPTVKGRHPAQKLPPVQVLEGESAKAVLTMRPLFP